MNTEPIHGLGKTLRALSVFFVSLGVLISAVPLSTVLGVHTVQGVHIGGDLGWPSWIRSASVFVFIGAALFACYMLSGQKRGRLARVLLWSAALAGGVYAAKLIFGMLISWIQW
jgi:hypothetical protein